VQARIERVPGISNSNAYGGRDNEVRITFDPYEAAALGIDIPVLAGLTGNNNDISGGFNDVGRRQYTLRYAGKYDLDDFGEMVLDWRGGNPVRLRDIATVCATGPALCWKMAGTRSGSMRRLKRASMSST
jgi:multidrug efflux pump subunit AcrB